VLRGVLGELAAGEAPTLLLLHQLALAPRLPLPRCRVSTGAAAWTRESEPGSAARAAAHIAVGRTTMTGTVTHTTARAPSAKMYLRSAMFWMFGFHPRVNFGHGHGLHGLPVVPALPLPSDPVGLGHNAPDMLMDWREPGAAEAAKLPAHGTHRSCAPRTPTGRPGMAGVPGRTSARVPTAAHTALLGALLMVAGAGGAPPLPRTRGRAAFAPGPIAAAWQGRAFSLQQGGARGPLRPLRTPRAALGRDPSGRAVRGLRMAMDGRELTERSEAVQQLRAMLQDAAAAVGGGSLYCGFPGTCARPLLRQHAQTCAALPPASARPPRPTPSPRLLPGLLPDAALVLPAALPAPREALHVRNAFGPRGRPGSRARRGRG